MAAHMLIFMDFYSWKPKAWLKAENPKHLTTNLKPLTTVWDEHIKRGFNTLSTYLERCHLHIWTCAFVIDKQEIERKIGKPNGRACWSKGNFRQRSLSQGWYVLERIQNNFVLKYSENSQKKKRGEVRVVETDCKSSY